MRWPWQTKQVIENDKKRVVRENTWANVDPLGDVEANKKRAAALAAKAKAEREKEQ